MYCIRKIALVSTFIVSLIFSSTAFAETGELDLLDYKPVAEYPLEVQNSLPSELPAQYWGITDSNGHMLYCRGRDIQVKIASMTKIMTAVIAAEYPLETEFVVSEYCASIPGSTAELEAGDVVTLKELLKGLMLPSGNDAAYVIASGVGALMLSDEGNIEQADDEQACIRRFVEQMNARVPELKMTNSLFENPCGLDDGEFAGEQHSTAADVIKMERAYMANDYLAELASKSKDTMYVTRKGESNAIELENTNTLLKIRKEETKGTKTGFTDEAGACFAGVCNIDGDDFYTVVVGCENRQLALYATAQLWDWVRNARNKVDYTQQLPIKDGYFIVADMAVPEWLDLTTQVGFSEPIEVVKWYWQNDYEYKVDINELGEDDDKGDVIGTFSIVDTEDNVIEERGVSILSKVPNPSFLEKIYIFFARLFSPLTGAKTMAETTTYSVSPIFIGPYCSQQTIPIVGPVEDPDYAETGSSNIVANTEESQNELPNAA